MTVRYHLTCGRMSISKKQEITSAGEMWRKGNTCELLAEMLRVTWTARRSNQSVLKEINPQCSLEGLILKLKLQFFGHLRWRADSLEKTLMLGKVEGKRRSGWQRMRWLDASPTQWTWTWANSGRHWRNREAWRAAVHGVAKSGTRLRGWTTTIIWQIVLIQPSVQHDTQ